MDGLREIVVSSQSQTYALRLRTNFTYGVRGLRISKSWTAHIKEDEDRNGETVVESEEEPVKRRLLLVLIIAEILVVFSVGVGYRRKAIYVSLYLGRPSKKMLDIIGSHDNTVT